MAYRNIIKMHTQKNKQVKYVNRSSCNFCSVARLLPEVDRIRCCYFLDIATHKVTTSVTVETRTWQQSDMITIELKNFPLPYSPMTYTQFVVALV